MSKRLKINGKTIFSVIIVALLVAVVVALVVMMNSEKTTYNDDYFKSDGTKIVSEITPDVAFLNDDENGLPEPEKAYMVYYYAGDKITDLKTFYKYENTDDAKEIYDLVVETEIPWADSKELSGVYVIVDMVKSEYDGLTPDIVRSFSD